MVEPGAAIHPSDQPISALVMKPNSSNQPDYIRLGSLTMRVIQHSDNFYIRIWDMNSPNRANLGG